VSTTTVEDIYELSPLQRGMLLHAVHDGASDMYFGQHVYVVDGHLDTEALIRAWRMVFESHPALRTSFHWDGLDKPLQVVHGDVMPPAHREDWSDLDEELQRDRLDLLMAEDRATGFDLTVAPLQRLHVIRLGDNRHALAWSHHHLLLDGWSVPIFMNEVMAHYQSLTVGGPRPPAAPPFRDYIAWLQRQDMDAARNFWKEVLAGVTPGRLAALQPLDPRRGTGGVDRHVVSLPGSTEASLRDAAARHQVTLNTMLHAAWAVVLSRYTGRRDVVFGCVSSGRPAELPHVDRMIGMFVNTLPVPVSVPEDGDVGRWLRDIQSVYAAIRRYEFSPLSDIKKWAGVPGQQLFDSLLVLDNYAFGVEAGRSQSGQLTVRSQTSYDKVSVPLSLVVTPAPVSQVHLVLHQDRFGPGFADDVLDCLLTTLDAITRADRVGAVVSAAGPLPETVQDGGRDRTAPEEARGGPPVPPATPQEQAIAAVYGEVLEMDDIDVTTSFFDLGGDSFGAVRAVGRIDGATVAMLALNPSVRDLAAALAAAGPQEGGDELDAEIAELERQLAETDDLKRRLTEFYTLGEEENRLADSGHGRLEFERTKEIVLRHLPPPPAVIADIGGGPGRYALWLAGLGYRVVHRDIVPLHVEQLRSAVGPGGAVESEVGDARSLDLADESVAAVLLLGPLYHLPRQADRVLALREARRIVKPGGAVFVAALSRWAARLDGVLRERMYERGLEMLDLIESVERTGVLPSLARAGYTAYTHRPRDLQSEFRSAGLEVIDLVSVEGAAFLLSMNDLTERMGDSRARLAILEGARAHERVPELLGLGPHLVATGLRP
jgi:non-ribosomal peptide synthetase component F/SAM-dependent methyltransferase